MLKEMCVSRAEVYREITKLGGSIPMNEVQKTLKLFDKDGYGIIVWGRLQIELTNIPNARQTVLLRVYRYEEL